MQIIAQASNNNGLNLSSITSTVAYTFLGITIMLLALVLVNVVFKLNMKRELVEENNTAYGLMIAGVSVAIAIIIAGTTLS